MSYHTECDWCGEWLEYDDDQAQMSVTICHRKGKSRLDAEWSEETKQTRHFCAAPKEDTDRGGRDRAGLVPDERLDSCYDRAIAAITRTELSDPGMGMEWRLVQISESPSRPTEPEPASDDDLPRESCDLTEHPSWQHVGGLSVIYGRLDGEATRALDRAGLRWLDDIDAISDTELLGVRGIGAKRLAALRLLLDAYYWRGNPGASRRLWCEIHDRMSQSLGYKLLPRVERKRIEAGIKFAERVLTEHGRPLENPKAPREAVA